MVRSLDRSGQLLPEARAIGEGMTRYLSALPEALYALFGTGYLGYTAARQWGKVKGVDQ